MVIGIGQLTGGLGDVTVDCGPTPCTIWDNLIPLNAFMSQTCKDWICCANPGGSGCTSVTKGVVAGAAQGVSSEITQTAADAVTSFFSGINPIGLAVVVLLGVVVLSKVRR